MDETHCCYDDISLDDGGHCTKFEPCHAEKKSSDEIPKDLKGFDFFIHSEFHRQEK
jgi:hypothetical protein